ncbi:MULTISPECIES: hypothetical protein [Pseudoalteromonas]|uniref:Uncharacterized protein n=1 Tax=Pseudoalteromonas peptidolytica F12-50-A1 TaxID=1315280 RepID=A0A8I0MU84_9GAMM|nr:MULTISPECIES: hypothetical protein [Pseudoalteromonas]MBE0345997.1 hypothetical protein [Pseudoalteromonas peptidolytica F12-50-A1]NLR14756.1 hypothetical protein [Pseudoalteromonas peptidolytica]RXF02573.1 hypothetical protein D9603_10345 [Pseudoalteromonas sp. PS5]GEK10922.1 hypothetical protein PPE03_31710 [Pseudoalteromonas peptidolytica]
MRLVLAALCTSLLIGCVTTAPLAPKLAVPQKPLLKKSVYQISYSTELNSARIKSVQLPAHPLIQGNTIAINAAKVSLTDTLRKQIVSLLEQKGLQVVATKQADYTLTIHQLDLEFAANKTYALDRPRNPHPHIAELAQNSPAFQCSNIVASVSMRLSHQASSDVVWFAKSSVDSAGFQGIPLQFTFTEEEKIANEREILSFIAAQNTEEARRQRSSSPVEIPSYKVTKTLSSLEKTAGACTQTEVSALTADMQVHLAESLIEKLNVK